MPKPIPSHDEVRSAFDNGSTVNASKEDLEMFLIANGQARIINDANQARASEMGETMRQLLAARQSQEMHSEALGISKVALWFAVAAFVASLVQAAVAMNIIAPLESPLIGKAIQKPEQPPPPLQKITPPSNSYRCH